MKRWIIGLVVLIVVLVGAFAAAVATLNSTDWSEYEEPIANAVEDATGRRVTFGGEVSVNLGLSPAIVANRITFQNADWGSRTAMLLLDKVAIRLKLVPLIFGSVEINQVKIIGLDMLLETDAEGNGNWAFGDAVTETEAAEIDEADSASALLTSAFLHAALIEDVNLTYNDGVTGETQQVRINSLKANMASADSPLTLSLDAKYQEEAISLEGSIEGVAEVLRGGPLGVDLTLSGLGAKISVAGAVVKPLDNDGIDLAINAQGNSLTRLTEFAGSPVPELGAFDVGIQVAGSADSLVITDLSANLDAAGASINIHGAVEDLLNVKGIDIALKVDGSSLAALSKLADSELPDIGAFSLAGNIAGSDEKFDVSELLVKLGQTELTGQVRANIGVEPLEIDAVLNAPKIDLVKLGLAEEPAPEPAAKATVVDQNNPENERVFPDDPLPLEDLSALDNMRGRVVLTVGELIVDSATTLSNLAIGVDLEPRKIGINPLKVTYMDAVVSGQIQLDITRKLAAVKADMAIAHPDLGSLLKAQDTDVLSNGPVDITIDIVGRGNSVADIMASLNGKLIIEMGAAKVHDAWAQRAMTNVVNVVAKRGKTEPVDLNCVTADFDINEGVAIPASLVINTPTLSLFGQGRIDLGDETLRLDFDRLATGVSASGVLPPFKVGGTLASPSGAVDVGALGSKFVGLGASLVTRGEKRSEVTAEAGPERCQQILVVYNEVLEDRAQSKAKTLAAAGKATLVTKEVTKSTLGKVRGFFGRKKKKDDVAP